MSILSVKEKDGKTAGSKDFQKYLTFQLDTEIYAVEIEYVTEIIGIQKITKVPETPVYMRGLINLRGQVLPVIDMRIRFGKPEIEYNDRTCIVIIRVNDASVGLIVDMVSEVLTIPTAEILPVPDQKTGFSNRFVKNILNDKDVVKLILDADKLIVKEG